MNNAYVDALKVELAGATDPQHIKEIQVELSRFGESVERAVASVKKETARSSKAKKIGTQNV